MQPCKRILISFFKRLIMILLMTSRCVWMMCISGVPIPLPSFYQYIHHVLRSPLPNLKEPQTQPKVHHGRGQRFGIRHPVTLLDSQEKSRVTSLYSLAGTSPNPLQRLKTLCDPPAEVGTSLSCNHCMVLFVVFFSISWFWRDPTSSHQQCSSAFCFKTKYFS